MDKIIAFCREKFNIELDSHQISLLNSYEEFLLEWNKKFNLTAITKHEEIWYRHFIDSMSVLSLIKEGTKRIIDIGTGAGFPGVVLKIIRPELEIALIDSTNKKVTFLQELIKHLGLNRIEARCMRAEEMAKDPVYREKYDYAVTRAVSSFMSCVELSAGFVKKDGSVLLMRGPRGKEELDNSISLFARYSLSFKESIIFNNPHNNMSSNLIELRKINILDSKYPRQYAQILKDYPKL